MNITQTLQKWHEETGKHNACNLCDYGVNVGHNRYCKRDRPNAPQPVEEKRRPGGSCGPEALHLDIPSHRVEKVVSWMTHAMKAQSDLQDRLSQKT